MDSKQTIEHLTQFFCYPLHVASALNQLSIADFKRIYQAHGFKRWPYNKYKNKTTSQMSAFQEFQINAPKVIAKQKKTIQKKVQKPKSNFDKEFENFCNNLNTDDSEVVNLFQNYLNEEEPLFSPVVL
jgi:hypothetical protein